MKRLVLALALGALVGVSNSEAQELLTNPGFEDVNSDTNYGDGWSSYGAAGFHAFFGANGHASLFMDNPGNFGGVYQTGIPGVGGMTYKFDLLDVRIESSADADVRFGLEYYLGDDSTAAGPFDLVTIPVPPTGDGLSFSMMATAPVGTQFIRPIIQFDNVQSLAGGQENMFVFGASLTKVPEPASGLLFVMGATAIVAAANKRRGRLAV